MIRFLGEHDSICFIYHLCSIAFDVIFIQDVMEFIELVIIISWNYGITFALDLGNKLSV